MMEPTETQRRVQQWFRAKRRELLASADLAADHPTLIGSHREFFTREFLKDFLPGRLSADRGLIYDYAGHSGECDVVIWDSANFPRLAMLDHSSFFVESVISVVELKSRYSRAEFDACRARCEAIRRMRLATHSYMRFGTELSLLWDHVYALQDGVDYEGQIRTEIPIAYIVVFIKGGSDVDLDVLVGDHLHEVHDDFPDAAVFVEPGKFVRRYEPSYSEWRNGERAVLQFSNHGDDVLMAFADELLRSVALRSFGTDGLYDLGPYKPWSFADDAEREEVEYPITHAPGGCRSIFGESRRNSDGDPEPS